MIEAVLHEVLIEVPRAMAIWLALLVLALLTLAAVLAEPNRAWRRRRAAGATESDPARSDATRPGPVAVTPVRRVPESDGRLRESDRRQRLAVKARELHRYADEVAVAADRAAQTAQRRRAEWEAAQEEVETTWRVFDDADNAVRRLAAAAAFPTPRTPRTPAEYADRERYLHRAAMRACGHGELSALTLSDALAHRGGWDPRRHPVEQELVLRRVIRDGALTRHRAALDREREAWRDAELAGAAARSLRAEAASAALAARQARRWLTPASEENPPSEGSVYRSRSAPGWRWRAARAG